MTAMRGRVSDVTGLGLSSNPAETIEKDNHSVKADRVGTIDAVRGFAVVGILLRNIFLFAMPASAYVVPIEWGGTEIDLAAMAFTEIFVDGAMRALFCIVFGASMLLMLNRHGDDRRDANELFHRRQLLLIAFGLVHAYLLLSPIDILFVYGVVGMAAYVFRNLSPRWLLSLAGALLFVGVMAPIAVNWISSYEIAKLQAAAGIEADTQGSDTAIATSEDKSEEKPDEETGTGNNSESDETGSSIDPSVVVEWQNEIEERHQDYVFNMLTIAEASFENHAQDLFKSHFTDVGALFLIGMALFKLGVLTGKLTTRQYLALMVVGYGIAIPINTLETFPELAGLEVTNDAGDWTNWTYHPGRIGMALGHLSVLILVTRLKLMKLVFDLLKAGGRMALTNYVMQTVICAYIFFGYGLARFGTMTHSEILLLGFAIGLGQLVFSRLYLLKFRSGPLEWLLRRLTRFDLRGPGQPTGPLPPPAPAQ